MTKRNGSPNLESLLQFLDGLTERASAKELRTLLEAATIELDDVRDYVRFGEDSYLRNLVREGPHYHALVLCWRSGQRSPIHDHAHSTCGLRVLTGVATETLFQQTPSTLVKAVSSFDRRADDVCVSQDSFIHQVSNLQSPGEDLVTFHVYSPPLVKMSTYSLTERTVGEYRPMVLQHALGSGI